MLQAIPENSAVGASASNGRAERAVQTFEDLCRTYKSALDTRITATVLCTLPIFRWLVEHVASNLNRYSVNPDGRTPYEDHHGKKAVHQMVELGESVLYYAPKGSDPSLTIDGGLAHSLESTLTATRITSAHRMVHLLNQGQL